MKFPTPCGLNGLFSKVVSFPTSLGVVKKEAGRPCTVDSVWGIFPGSKSLLSRALLVLYFLERLLL